MRHNVNLKFKTNDIPQYETCSFTLLFVTIRSNKQNAKFGVRSPKFKSSYLTQNKIYNDNFTEFQCPHLENGDNNVTPTCLTIMFYEKDDVSKQFYNSKILSKYKILALLLSVSHLK